ncbi:MAG: type IV pilus modification protein PilV [Thiothrix sp.]|nr:MAG: type IV pilus modification protein PilV [Thiothrix sp.]
MKRTARRLQHGLNLLEVLIATLVLSLGLLGLAGLQISSLKSTQNASLKQEATFVLYELLERMRSNRQATLDGSYTQTTKCSNPPPGNCTATTCSGTQQASLELYEVLCRSGSNHLPAAQLVITCPKSANCGLGLHFHLTWEQRLEQLGIQQGRAAGTEANGSTVDQEQEAMSLVMDAVI